MNYFKANYVLQRGLGGAMLWDLPQDDFSVSSALKNFYAKNFDSYFVDRMALILVEIFIPDWLKIFTYDLNQPIGPLPFC